MNAPAHNPYTSPKHGGPINLFKGQGPVTINAAATTGTIISFSLISGVFTIAGVLLFLMPQRDTERPLLQMDFESMTFLAVGGFVFVGSTVATFLVRSAMKRQSSQMLRDANESLPQPLKSDSPLPESAQRFLGAVATYTLIGQALMEGPAIVNLVLMFLDENYLHLIPVALGVIGIVLQIPTAGRLQSAIETAHADRS